MDGLRVIDGEMTTSDWWETDTVNRVWIRVGWDIYHQPFADVDAVIDSKGENDG